MLGDVVGLLTAWVLTIDSGRLLLEMELIVGRRPGGICHQVVVGHVVGDIAMSIMSFHCDALRCCVV